MSRRVTNLALLAVCAALVATGLAGWALPELAASPLYGAHRIVGLALLLFLVAKYGIARSSLRRRVPRGPTMGLALSLAAAIALVATVALGLGWTIGVLSFDAPWSYSALNLHVFAGLALLALVALHAVVRWERRGRRVPLVDRRSALRLVGLGAAAIVLAPILERLAADRRVTGSKHAGSFTANGLPVTIWSFDSVPAIDGAAWRLEVAGAVAAPGELGYADLAALASSEVVAIIDCTGGWWSEQRWRGARIGDLIARHRPLAGATSATVVSTTGHRWTFGLDELEAAVLATHVGAEPLSPAHGFPARLAIPGRRGFQWIKWVERIEVA